MVVVRRRRPFDLLMALFTLSCRDPIIHGRLIYVKGVPGKAKIRGTEAQDEGSTLSATFGLSG